VYNLLQQFRSTVNAKGTKALKATANKRLDQALAQFTTNPDGNKSILGQTQRPLEQLLGLLEAYDNAKARLTKDAPSQFPEFVANTQREVDALREHVGEPDFPSDMSPLNSFEQKSYLVRKDWLVQAAEIQRRTVTTNIADPNVASNGMYRARLNLLLPHLVDYHSKSAEPGALKALWQEVVNRDHRQGKP
jgi:hypothetical protein